MKSVSIIGVPSDYGQRRRGVDMGPSAIRYAGVEKRLKALGYVVNDYGDIRLQETKKSSLQDTKLRNLEEIIHLSESLATKVSESIENSHIPLVLGGDHSIAIGTLAGLGNKYENLGVIWFDAHADINTPDTTPSGNIHGMPLAVSLGLGQVSGLHTGRLGCAERLTGAAEHRKPRRRYNLSFSTWQKHLLLFHEDALYPSAEQ